jgi:DNA-binding PadR family transcriptional regulator
MAYRSRSNPLALAVLTCLFERPMHPYEIGQTLRFRAKQENIRLNYGSLYGVVESLVRRKLIRAVETTREGRRPQRTVYEITDRGTVEMHEWLSELVSVPVKEYLQYEAALSLIAGLPPDEVLPLLEQRCIAIEMRIEQARALHEAALKRGLPRLFFIEDEYIQALAETELAFTRKLIADMRSGDLDGLDAWRQWHDDPSGSSFGELAFPATCDDVAPDDDTDDTDPADGSPGGGSTPGELR